MAVLISNAIGLPVSTSHCLVGALIGTGFAAKIFPYEGGRSPPSLDVAVLKKIVLAWVVTIPLALALALMLYVPLRAALAEEVQYDANSTSSLSGL